MAHRDRCIPIEEHDAEWLSDDVAPADDHGMFSFDREGVMLEESDDSCGGGRRQMFELFTKEHFPEVVGSEAVDILLGINSTMDKRKS